MRRKWTRETVIRHLLEREAKGLPLTVGGEGVDKSLYGAARKIFGSWRNAIQAAGIVPHQVLTWERWSPARILVMIRHLARRDRPLSTYQTERRYPNLVTAARRHYGSWTKAILAAGVEPTKLQRVIPWTPERIIEAILTRALRSESLVARLVEPRSLVDASQRLFGNWPAAVTAAGLDATLTVKPAKSGQRPRTPKGRLSRAKLSKAEKLMWSKERVITAIHARLREQRPMNSGAISKDDKALFGAIRRHHRTWHDAMLAAGLNPETYRLGPCQMSSPERGTEDGVSDQSQADDVVRPESPA